mmetsp:Transcript_5640/g.8481  ORF Transcript_5640/g.8481 Transcript_5640/m.8481 type:complete len:629 (-) Transcript_5640:247-2133(-)
MLGSECLYTKTLLIVLALARFSHPFPEINPSLRPSQKFSDQSPKLNKGSAGDAHSIDDHPLLQRISSVLHDSLHNVMYRYADHDDGFESRDLPRRIKRGLFQSDFSTTLQKPPQFEGRVLGSFEKMLAKQRKGSEVLSTPHVWVAIFDERKISMRALNASVAALLSRHPMLRASIQGTGLPEKVVLNTIRNSKDDFDPLRFEEIKDLSLEEIAACVLRPTKSCGSLMSFEKVWREEFEMELEDARFDRKVGPNWRARLIECRERSALLFTMNHAIEDQKSANSILNEILVGVEEFERAKFSPNPSLQILKRLDFEFPVKNDRLPPSMETAIVGDAPFTLSTMSYLARKAVSGLLKPLLVHDHLSSDERANIAERPEARQTICEFRVLEESVLNKMLKTCKENKVSLTSALCSATIMACSDVSHSPDSKRWNNYKFLLAVDLRKFGQGNDAAEGDWTGGSVACAGGAMDWVEGISANAGKELRSDAGGEKATREFWRVAHRCKREIANYVKSEVPKQAVSVFDFGMKSIEIGEVCELEARREETLGRAYTCGVSNMGKYPYSGTEKYVGAIHYATSHSPWGSLYQLSCGTVGGKLSLTFQFVEPIVSREMGREFVESFMGCLEKALLVG